MKNQIDPGMRFSRLTTIKREKNTAANKTRWLCVCDCGEYKVINSQMLREGRTRSCGCMVKDMLIERNTTHGYSKHPLYGIWRQMVRRCTNPKDKAYRYYGGRGIQVFGEWMNFNSFINDMGDKPEGMTLEREDNDGDYCPDNCIWASWSKQHENRRSTKLSSASVFFARFHHHNGASIGDLAEFFSVHKTTMASAIRGTTWASTTFPYQGVKT